MSGSESERLLRRDIWLLPLIALLTVALMAGSCELVARTYFYESMAGMGACFDYSDPARGVRGRPLTRCHVKSRESDDVEFRLDAKGYRNDPTLVPRRPEVLRIVLIGSSIAMGERVRAAGSPAVLLAQRLSMLTGRQVEVYNEGMAYGFARNADMHFQDSIDAKPQLILWLVTPLDVARSEVMLTDHSRPAGGGSRQRWLKAQLLHYIRAQGGDSRGRSAASAFSLRSAERRPIYPRGAPRPVP